HFPRHPTDALDLTLQKPADPALFCHRTTSARNTGVNSERTRLPMSIAGCSNQNPIKFQCDARVAREGPDRVKDLLTFTPESTGHAAPSPAGSASVRLAGSAPPSLGRPPMPRLETAILPSPQQGDQEPPTVEEGVGSLIAPLVGMLDRGIA